MQKALGYEIISHMTMNNQQLQAVGPTSLFATWVTIRTMLPYNRLATIRFNDPAILQRQLKDRYTDYRLVLYGDITQDETMLSLWIVRGNIGFVVALLYLSEWHRKVELTEEYQEFACERKLTQRQISDIFTRIFDNPSLIKPIETLPQLPKTDLSSNPNAEGTNP